MRRLAVTAVAASVLALAGPAWAAGDCPEGDWFCEPVPPTADPPPRDAGPPPETGAGPRRRLPPAPPPPPQYPPDDGEIRIDVPEMPPPRPRHRRGFREWGFNLHAVIGLMGSDRNMSPDADMNGLGLALRFRPIPHIAIEGSLEAVWGTDYNGFDRFENALLLNALFFANPRSAVQVYGLAGFGGAAAFIDSGVRPDGQPVLRDETYTYGAVQAGAGLEARITRHFAIGGDLIGFLRWRRDRHADRNPEFIDPSTGRTTNTSGGGLLRLGMTFYW
jgi:hypothetical protein